MHWKMIKIGRDHRRVYSHKEEISLVKLHIYIVLFLFFCMRVQCNSFSARKRELKHKFAVVFFWHFYHKEEFGIAWVYENQERKSWGEKSHDWLEGKGLMVPKSVRKHFSNPCLTKNFAGMGAVSKELSEK